jgi:hypothetical protein
MHKPNSWKFFPPLEVPFTFALLFLKPTFHPPAQGSRFISTAGSNKVSVGEGIWRFDRAKSCRTTGHSLTD